MQATKPTLPENGTLEKSVIFQKTKDSKSTLVAMNEAALQGATTAPWENPKLEAEYDGEYLTERLTNETLSFIDSQRKQDSPFFAYLSYYNVHTPIQPYKKRMSEYKEKLKTLDGETPIIEERNAHSRGRQDNAELASMVAAVDDSVGTILAKLVEWQL